MQTSVVLIILLPLAGFILNGIGGKRFLKESLSGWIGSLAVGVPFLLAYILLLTVRGGENHERAISITLFPWISAGSLNTAVSYRVDELSLFMTLIVTGVGFLIHVYSIGYMHGDRGFRRFFAFMNLFIFMMLNLVLADNYVLMFLGWEGVGLCSYLLIGFWYDRHFEGTSITWTGDAANKAFWVNRIGDLAFLLGLFLLFHEFGTLTYEGVFSAAKNLPPSTPTLTWATLLLFIGATGKSAQIPLFVWLPDAMAGPTPVSALIHAATMVTAGVYMVARNSLLFALAPATLTVIAVIGAATALLAASIGLLQNDIKKVLAYSTVSQLGFMFLALGVGAFSAAMFHLMTHAFFKACLFLGAGSVIHALRGEQDIRNMGGLRPVLPVTFLTFMVSSFTIAGFPPLSGFFSKDEILSSAFSNGSPLLWAIGAGTALMTAFYIFRLSTLVFDGENRFPAEVKPHESPRSMTIPLIVLASLAAVSGLFGVPESLGGRNMLHGWFTPIFTDAVAVIGAAHPHERLTEYLLMTVSVCIALTGFILARRIYRVGPSADDRLAKSAPLAVRLLKNKYFIDEIYQNTIADPLVTLSDRVLNTMVDVRIIDGFVNGSARLTSWLSGVLRRLQTGFTQHYASLLAAGVLIVLLSILLS